MEELGVDCYDIVVIIEEPVYLLDVYDDVFQAVRKGVRFKQVALEASLVFILEYIELDVLSYTLNKENFIEENQQITKKRLHL